MAVFDEVEERVGEVHLGAGAETQAEGPEVLAVPGVGAESDEVDVGVGAEQVSCLESRERFGGRYRTVDQRHEFAVAGVEDLVERDVAARADVQGAYARDIDVAAQRGEGRVELAAEGRAFHEIGGRVLGREAACQEQGEEERVEFLHVGRRFRG